jgi:hypothetical protein
MCKCHALVTSVIWQVFASLWHEQDKSHGLTRVVIWHSYVKTAGWTMTLLSWIKHGTTLFLSMTASWYICHKHVVKMSCTILMTIIWMSYDCHKSLNFKRRILRLLWNIARLSHDSNMTVIRHAICGSYASLMIVVWMSYDRHLWKFDNHHVCYKYSLLHLYNYMNMYLNIQYWFPPTTVLYFTTVKILPYDSHITVLRQSYAYFKSSDCPINVITTFLEHV